MSAGVEQISYIRTYPNAVPSTVRSRDTGTPATPALRSVLKSVV